MQVSWYPSLLWFFFLRNLAVPNKMTYNKCIHIMKESGHKVCEVRPTVKMDPAISTHPDIYMCALRDSVYHGERFLLNPYYPAHAIFNGCSTGKYFIHNLKYTAPDLLKAVRREGQIEVHVAQGYAKCSCVVVDEDSIITADALNTQKETAKAIIKAKGNYVLALKANQGIMYQEVSEYFHDNDLLKELEYYSETEKSHSKFIKREYYMTKHINWITNYKEWKNIKSIGYERKTIESLNNDKKTIEERFFIISFENDIKIFADAVRKHWGIENNLHAPLDIVFKEDDNTTLEKNGARNLSVLKRIALNIIKLVQCFYNISLKLIRYKISMNTEEELEKIFKTINTTQIKSMLENQT